MDRQAGGQTDKQTDGDCRMERFRERQTDGIDRQADR